MKKHQREARAQYIIKRVEAVKNKPTEIKRLAVELQINERTVRRALKKQ